VAAADVVPRRAGRVLPVDPSDRVLLLHGFEPSDPGHPFWFTVGGGTDPGESLAEAAARELREEVGIAVDVAALGDPVWHRTVRFAFAGTHYRQQEEYYLLRVASREVSMEGMDDSEKQTVLGHGWWSAAEIESLTDPYLPPELPALLRNLTSPEA
jgi:8-oxo-dGTP pyrophosphatase MutT (NUDIX family)